MLVKIARYLCYSHKGINDGTKRTSRIEAVRVDRASRPLRELDCSEDICRLGFEIGAEVSVRLRARMLDRIEIDARAEHVRDARDEDHARGITSRRSRQEFRFEHFREHKGPDVVGGHLALQAVSREFEGPDGRGGIVDEDLGEGYVNGNFAFNERSAYMYRLRVGVDLCCGFSDACEGREVEREPAYVGVRNIRLDGVLGELQSKFNG